MVRRRDPAMIRPIVPSVGSSSLKTYASSYRMQAAEVRVSRPLWARAG